MFALGEERARKLGGLWRAEGREGADEAAEQIEAALARQDCHTLAQLQIGGRQLTAMGLRGPAVGETLRELLFAVMDGRIENEESALLDAAKRLSEKK